MISLLLPTRQRPQQLHRLVSSVNATASRPDMVELVTYIDADDHSYDDLDLSFFAGTWMQVRGPREHAGLVNLSVMWNACFDACSGGLVMHAGDDIVFRTPGWDEVVREAFDEVPDKVLFAFGRDGYQDANNFGTHGFVHRTWIETVGFFVPPYFVSDFNDAFLNDVAKLIDRHREIPIYTEHMHYLAGKAEVDLNTRERIARHETHKPQELYASAKVQNEIAEAANNLLGIMQ